MKKSFALLISLFFLKREQLREGQVRTFLFSFASLLFSDEQLFMKEHTYICQISVYLSIHLSIYLSIYLSTYVHGQLLSHVSDSVTPWTADCQATLSVGLSQQEYWSGVSFLPPAESGFSPMSISHDVLCV